MKSENLFRIIVLALIVSLAYVVTSHAKEGLSFMEGRSLDLSVFSEKPKGIEVIATSYNPVRGQTDASPCIGASLIDLCRRSKEGGKVIALSQDLVGGSNDKPFVYGDVVVLSSPCVSGEFVVLDTMNKRFTNRVDIFFLDKRENIGKCIGKLFKRNIN